METYEDGVTTVYWKRPTRHSEKAPLLVFLPGNPGLSEYYVRYVDELAKLLPGVEIFCPSHLGYSTTTISEGHIESAPTFTLDDQVDHKIELIRKLTRDGRRPLYLLGHSVGSWFAQRTAIEIGKVPTADLQFVGLITPTVHNIADSDKGRNLSGLARIVSADTVAWAGQQVSWALSRLPRAVLDFAIGRIVSTDHGIDATTKLVQRPGVVRQFIHMGAEEMSRIQDESEVIDAFYDSARNYGVWFFFAERDGWVPPKTRDLLYKRHLDRPRVQIETDFSGVKHSFCLADYLLVAEHTATAIANLVPGMQR